MAKQIKLQPDTLQGAQRRLAILHALSDVLHNAGTQEVRGAANFRRGIEVRIARRSA